VTEEVICIYLPEDSVELNINPDGYPDGLEIQADCWKNNVPLKISFRSNDEPESKKFNLLADKVSFLLRGNSLDAMKRLYVSTQIFSSLVVHCKNDEDVEEAIKDACVFSSKLLKRLR
jgi:hypothetical protein